MHKCNCGEMLDESRLSLCSPTVLLSKELPGRRWIDSMTIMGIRTVDLGFHKCVDVVTPSSLADSSQLPLYTVRYTTCVSSPL